MPPIQSAHDAVKVALAYHVKQAERAGFQMRDAKDGKGIAIPYEVPEWAIAVLLLCTVALFVYMCFTICKRRRKPN